MWDRSPSREESGQFTLPAPQLMALSCLLRGALFLFGDERICSLSFTAEGHEDVGMQGAVGMSSVPALSERAVSWKPRISCHRLQLAVARNKDPARINDGRSIVLLVFGIC